MRETIESVLKQSFQDFELICINDGSTDRSLLILEEYASKDSRVIVYSKPNTGIPAITKNHGIDRSAGEYIFILDADDYLSPDVLQNMYYKSKEMDADVVLPDLVNISEEGEGLTVIGLKGNRNIVLTNRQAVVQSLDWTIHSLGLWRGSLIRKLRFEEFGVNSDEYSYRVWFFNCRKIVFCEGSYFYRHNAQSITRKISVKLCDGPYNTYRLALFLEQNSFDDNIIFNTYSSAFKDCCFLISIWKELAPVDRAVAERKLKAVYDLIDKDKVRKYLFRECGMKKYIWIISTVLNWSLLKNSFPIYFLLVGLLPNSRRTSN